VRVGSRRHHPDLVLRPGSAPRPGACGRAEGRTESFSTTPIGAAMVAGGRCDQWVPAPGRWAWLESRPGDFGLLHTRSEAFAPATLPESAEVSGQPCGAPDGVVRRGASSAARASAEALEICRRTNLSALCESSAFILQCLIAPLGHPAGRGNHTTAQRGTNHHGPQHTAPASPQRSCLPTADHGCRAHLEAEQLPGPRTQPPKRYLPGGARARPRSLLFPAPPPARSWLARVQLPGSRRGRSGPHAATRRAARAQAHSPSPAPPAPGGCPEMGPLPCPKHHSMSK
jgi:hypothetical protein